jgi:hypothetical protein
VKYLKCLACSQYCGEEHKRERSFQQMLFHQKRERNQNFQRRDVGSYLFIVDVTSARRAMTDKRIANMHACALPFLGTLPQK